MKLGEWVARWIGWSESALVVGPRGLGGYLALSRLPGFGESLEPRMTLLARQLAAQLSGCRWCINRSEHDWRRSGLSSELLHQLASYSTSGLYTARERAALAFVHAAACSAESADYLRRARVHLSETELAELTAIVADHHCLDTTDLTSPAL
jgi:alkylhydroperoxidase family enzyme